MTAMPAAAAAELADLGYDHFTLRLKSMQARRLERAKTSLELQRGALKRDGLPDILMIGMDKAIAALKPVVRRAKREVGACVKGSPLGDWIEETHGLSNALVLVLGCMPPLNQFYSPRAVWKYTGLDVQNGRAPKSAKGELLGFNRELRAFVIARVAETIIKVGGPYRTVYDVRKAHTLITHPEMLEEGEVCANCDMAWARTREIRAEHEFERERKAPSIDCAGVGGVHWTKGHRHADARRLIAKAVLRDAWCVANGRDPSTMSEPHLVVVPD